jgi:hypothetical protein
MPNADPDPRGNVTEHIAVADDRDIMLSTESAAQIQRGSMSGEACSDDNNFSHTMLLSGWDNPSQICDTRSKK